MSYLNELNDRQKEAAESTEGPLLIIAGAGAGKTKTITHRILHLIKKGVEPREILAITFTNKAAKEMKERVGLLLQGDQAISGDKSEIPENKLRLTNYQRNSPWIGTFHSLGVHIIREQHKVLGLPKHFTIYDRDDSKRAVREAMKICGIDTKSFEPGKLLSVISKEKGNLVTVDDFEKKAGRSYTAETVSRVWKEYEKILKDEKALDFDDLLLKTAFLLKKDPQVREHYQQVWKYIHIDEYQDTNESQYQIAKIIAEGHKNIAVVGDADQLIYGWRGASIKNIMDFEKDYPDAKVVTLEQNYRSTQTILTVANRVIQKNKMRRDKILFTKKEEGDKVSLYGAYDQNDEAKFVAKKAQELIDSGISPKEIAVLYRANFQGRALEEGFLHTGTPYQVLGTKFFERKEVKDVIAYLRASLSQDSLTDVKRVINTPPRGIGKVTLLKIFSDQSDNLPMAVKEKVHNFKSLLNRIKEVAEKEALSQTIKFILKETGLEAMFQERGGKNAFGKEESMERLENMRELVTYATRYDNLPPSEGLDRFLTDTALQSDQDELIKEQSAVKLMTIHSSKGLEYEYVFITGLEEGLFPHKGFGEASVDASRNEEERRLYYVAITRAKKKLFVSYASVRTIFGSQQINMPSEFISDIDDEFLEKEEKFDGGVKTIYLD